MRCLSLLGDKLGWNRMNGTDVGQEMCTYRHLVCFFVRGKGPAWTQGGGRYALEYHFLVWCD